MADENTDQPEAGQPEETAPAVDPEALSAPDTPPVGEDEAGQAAGEVYTTEAGLAAGLRLGEGAPAEEGYDPNWTPVIRGKLDRFGTPLGTGRRKTSVARVRITDGDGTTTVNGRALDDYFRIERDRRMIMAPLEAVDMAGKVNVWVRVEGGGTTGQAGAIILGIARALQAKNPTLHHDLSTGGFLTRDGRMVERKKYGFKKARRSFQFSKR
jgi:small subunit ribosomal protein S9